MCCQWPQIYIPEGAGSEYVVKEGSEYVVKEMATFIESLISQWKDSLHFECTSPI
jgi:uncharacterized protein YlzI (FlbEa/FlbD family)